MWGTFLSEPLDIVDMVGRYPAIYLMSREPIRFRNSLIELRCLNSILWGISRRFQRLFPRNGQVAHALRTLAPVAIIRTRRFRHAAPRLACVKPAASVHPEPGSNSSLYNLYISSLILTLIILSKELTLLDKLFFSVLASCTVNQSFQ